MLRGFRPTRAIVALVFLAACQGEEPAQVSVRFGAVRNALTVEGLSVRLEVTQGDQVVSSDEKPVDVTGGVATAALSFQDVPLDTPTTFDVTVLWATHANRVLLHARKDLPKVDAGTAVAIADGDIVAPDGKPDTDGDTASDLAEVIAGTDPDSATTRPSSGGSIPIVSIDGAAQRLVRFEETLPLAVTIDKGDGTLSTDPSLATWAVADSTLATVAVTGAVQAKTVVGQTEVTATYASATSAPVQIRVEPAKVGLFCLQGSGIIAGTFSHCVLRTQTAGGSNVENVADGAWHLTSSDSNVIQANDPDAYSSQGLLIAGQNDATATITATYDDGTPTGLQDVQQIEVVKVASISISASALTDVLWGAQASFPVAVTRASGTAMPSGFHPEQEWNPQVVTTTYSEPMVLTGGVIWPSALSVSPTYFGTTDAWITVGAVSSNHVSVRSIPKTVVLGTGEAVTVAPGASITLAVDCFADGLHQAACTVSRNTVQVTMTTASSAVATVTWEAPAPAAGQSGSQLSVTIQGVAAGQTTITGTVNGVTGPALTVNVAP